MTTSVNVTIHAGDMPRVEYRRSNDGATRWLNLSDESGYAVATIILNPAIITALRVALDAYIADRG